MAQLEWAIGLLAGADAAEEILHVGGLETSSQRNVSNFHRHTDEDHQE
jgi:hypothetical protein